MILLGLATIELKTFSDFLSKMKALENHFKMKIFPSILESTGSWGKLKGVDKPRLTMSKLMRKKKLKGSES